MCKEWTKIFNKTYLLHLGNSKGGKEKYNEDKVGTKEFVKTDDHLEIPKSLKQPSFRIPVAGRAES